MAGFEVVVRPVVFPNIRPAPPRVLAPEDDPTQGFATIGGSGGRSIDLPRNWSFSVSRNRPEEEVSRQFDNERVYQVDEQGNINENNYIDVERLKKVRLDSDKGAVKMQYADPPKADNIKTLQTDVTRNSGS
jgi:hypothetical protein